MSTSNLPIIAEYLRAHGIASAREIAYMLDVHPDSAARSMEIMESQGTVVRVGEGARDGKWKLVIGETPPIFRAMETLGAMQLLVVQRGI